MSKLKPCPFCGGKAILYVKPEGGITVMCWDCKATSKTRVDTLEFRKPTNAVESVIKAWNRRVGEEGEAND